MRQEESREGRKHESEEGGIGVCVLFFFFASRRQHTKLRCDWSSVVCSSDLEGVDVGDEGVDVGEELALARKELPLGRS